MTQTQRSVRDFPPTTCRFRQEQSSTSTKTGAHMDLRRRSLAARIEEYGLTSSFVVRIPPGQTGSVSHTFSVPEKTASVRALLIEAEFVDGTVWSAQESQTGIWNGLRQKQFRGAPERAGHRSGRLEQSSGRLLEPAADPWQNCFRTSCSVVMMFPCFLAGPDAGYGSCVLYA